MADTKPVVYMMLGLPGSGKTTFSKRLAAKLGLTRFALDEEYFAVVGNTQQEHRDFKIEAEISQKILDRVKDLINQGQSVVLDQCPWRYKERMAYRKFLEDQGAECKVYFFDIPKNELLQRLESRNRAQDQNTQFMTPKMLEELTANRFEPPRPDETVEVIRE